MTTKARGAARAVADVTNGTILASVEIAVPPERVFAALTTEEVTKWWGSDDKYRTTEWAADVKVGGRWRANGRDVNGAPFTVGGEYLEVDPPRKLVQTWVAEWDGGNVTTLTYLLEPTDAGTRVTLRHEGFADRAESCRGHSNGWERVFGWLVAYLAPSQETQFFLCKLIPPRKSFPFDMSAEEQAMMQEHVVFWTELVADGKALVFGPVLDPEGPWGLGVVVARDEAAAHALGERDPAILSGRGFRYQVIPMPVAVSG
jgi:uncharacterized protein YndB with AHSA1/START domain/uncharacterized protein YciI